MIYIAAMLATVAVLWPAPATSLYECEPGAIGFVLVSDHEGSPIFWLGRQTSAEVKYEDLICMLPGNHRVMVLSSEEKEM
jgi:hypothetical protein